MKEKKQGRKKKSQSRVAPVNHLSIKECVKLLRENGSTSITIDVLKGQIESGAPVNADGTIDLVQYAAWIHKQG